VARPPGAQWRDAKRRPERRTEGGRAGVSDDGRGARRRHARREATPQHDPARPDQPDRMVVLWNQ
jgi:hypothetical protein